MDYIVLPAVVSYRGTWVETVRQWADQRIDASYLIEVRGLKHGNIAVTYANV